MFYRLHDIYFRYYLQVDAILNQYGTQEFGADFLKNTLNTYGDKTDTFIHMQ